MTEQDLKSLYQSLEEYKDFSSNSENCEKFLEVVGKIVSKKDPNSLPVLLKYFDDESDYSWVMTSLRKFLESYPPREYVMAILKNLEFLVLSAIMYSDEILNSILNSEIHKEIFIANYRKASRKYLEQLFSYMVHESPHHAELLKELQLKLKKPY